MNSNDYMTGQRLLINEWLDCTYQGNGIVRVDAELKYEEGLGAGTAWYSCKSRYRKLTSADRVEVVK